MRKFGAGKIVKRSSYKYEDVSLSLRTDNNNKPGMVACLQSQDWAGGDRKILVSLVHSWSPMSQ